MLPSTRPVDLHPPAADQAFRAEAREWLHEQLTGDFAEVRGLGGSGSEHIAFDERWAWERHMGAHGWNCVGWPTAYGGRGATIAEEVIWHEEYARAQGPARVGIIGEGLLGPTLIAFGTDAQKARFLPPIVAGDELWCQGYSEPDAGSDLANVQTRAHRDGDEWVISGQKVWTSLAQWADWVFVLCRTDPDAAKHKGISYLLCPMRQDAIETRPIVQLTGTSEFNELFFDEARTPGDHVVGEVNGGWRVAMGTLAFERGTSTLGQQLGFEAELDAITADAQRRGRTNEPIVRQRLADAWIGLRIMRFNNLRSLSPGTGSSGTSGAHSGGEPGPEASINKLYWATWHRRLGELAVDLLGPAATVADGWPYALRSEQRLFLFSRSETIYAGSNQVQRNIIGERVLGLPGEPKA